jgi:hypothetical protein
LSCGSVARVSNICIRLQPSHPLLEKRAAVLNSFRIPDYTQASFGSSHSHIQPAFLLKEAHLALPKYVSLTNQVQESKELEGARQRNWVETQSHLRRRTYLVVTPDKTDDHRILLTTLHSIHGANFDVRIGGSKKCRKQCNLGLVPAEMVEHPSVVLPTIQIDR